MQQLQQTTELTELDKIILKDRLDRYAKVEDEAFSFPPRTAGVALAGVVAFYAAGNHLKPPQTSRGLFLTATFFLFVGFYLYSWTLRRRYDHAKRELSGMLLKLGVPPPNEVKNSHDLARMIVWAAWIMAAFVSIVLVRLKP